MKILITGASGLVGRPLIHRLLLEGHEVCALARSPKNLPELSEKNIFLWSDEKQPPKESIIGCDAIINLAGEGIADKRWTKERKKRIWDSRIEGTKNLIKTIASLKPEDRPKIFISGSAIGYYADSPVQQNENSSAGQGFLSELCSQWEKSAQEAENFGLRTVLLRTGLVLAKHGGVLKKTYPAVLGSGQQWMSWIHIEDIIRFIIFAMNTKTIKGPYNLTAPNPVTNDIFTKIFAKQMKIPFTFNIPNLFLKLGLGELSQAILANQNIFPEKAISAGFVFKFTKLEAALSDIYQNSNGIFNDNAK